MTEFNERDALDCDPFDGDYGGSGDADGVLRDKIVTAAKDYPGKCHLCAGDIVKGERHRSRSEVYDGELMQFRSCSTCCAAMALSANPGEDDDAEDRAEEAWGIQQRLGDDRRKLAAERLGRAAPEPRT